MTPYEIDQLHQERSEQQSTIANERYLDGSTDAGFGQLPQWADEDYLAGYIATVKRLPRDADGKILYRSEAFRCGAYDSPDDCACGEF